MHEFRDELLSEKQTLSPLGADRYKVQLTASKQLHDKLRQAQDLMRHELPSGDIAQVLERALDLLIADRMKRRFGQTTTSVRSNRSGTGLSGRSCDATAGA